MGLEHGHEISLMCSTHEVPVQPLCEDEGYEMSLCSCCASKHTCARNERRNVLGGQEPASSYS